MRRSKIMSMVLTMALIITSTLPGFVTASADNSFYDFKLHFVGEENSYEDVGIATIQGGQFSDGSWYQQLTPDKKDDVIIDVKIAPVREVSIAMYTSNWS